MVRRPTMTHDAFALFVADVYDTAGVLRRYGELVAGEAGQTQARWQLMNVVSEGNWTVPMAADRLGTSRQAVQRIANELLDEGLVHDLAHRLVPVVEGPAAMAEAALRILMRAARGLHHAIQGHEGGGNDLSHLTSPDRRNLSAP